ncbi:MAG: methyltransferase [Bacteroidetes bacterium GWE2_29_8]|nr:MAG: methyltransferase [Bacteroidetes bacterium GWE2_29_8]OFY24291.1 MAG: methyltransferase [Bacteroidetes bacterium GWF2_29_10]
MNFIDESLMDYVEKHSTPESEVLKYINRETHLKVLRPTMLAGHFQGQLLKMLSMMNKPKRVLEIGTFTGYSAICLAQGLTENGLLYTIDANHELEELIKSNIQKAGLSNKIKLIIGQAIDVIPAIKDTFDLIYIDADKENLINYYEMLIPMTNPNGIIIVDNVLWYGKVVETIAPNDIQTIAIDNFNKLVANDNRVENVIIPVRDGLNVIRKN